MIQEVVYLWENYNF